MVTVIAKIRVVPGKEAEFEQAARDMIAHVRANEPGTRTYVLHRAAGNPAEFLFYERYDDEAAFAAHGGSDAIRRFFGVTGSMAEGRPEITLYQEVDGKQ